MTFVERMDIFKLLYVERLTPSAIAAALNRKPSTITREIAKGMDNGMYNPIIAKAGHLEARRNQRPHLKMTGETRAIIKPQLEKRQPHEEVVKRLEVVSLMRSRFLTK
jgi:IS30 family transposase